MKSLLAIAAALALLAATPFDDFQRERSGKNDDAKNVLEGSAAPALEGDWLNVGGKKLDWTAFKGKVVVVDFWTHWCGPCRASVPHVKELLRKHAANGLVFVGVHSDANREMMAKAIRDLGITWPVVFDGEKTNFKRYAADSFPDYYIVDRNGVLRFADLANKEVDRAVEMLLAEKP